MAHATGLVERKRKLTGPVIAETLAFWKGDALGYADICAEISLKYKIDVTKQSLAKKLAIAEKFFQDMVTKALNEGKRLNLRAPVHIPGVGHVFIADSSVVPLKASLAAHLRGTGGNGPAASLKIHGLINLSTQQFARIALTDGKTSDHSEKKAHALILQPSDLIIRDLGYFDAADLGELQSSGRFYVTRIPLSLKTFSLENAESVDVWNVLATTKRLGFDGILALGEDGFKARTIALRLPREQARERLAAMRKEKGRELTSIEKARAKWNLYATNLSPGQASATTLQRLYTWRWQIELIFKAMKSVLDIDSVKTAKCETVVMAFVWARLLYAVVLMNARSIIQDATKQEIGVIRWYRRLSPQLSTMRDLLRSGKWCALARLLIAIATKFCRPEKRQRMTTVEKIRESSGMDALSTARSTP